MHPGAAVVFLLVFLSGALPLRAADADAKRAAEAFAARLDSANAEMRRVALGNLIELGLDEYLPQIQKAVRESDADTFTYASVAIWAVVHENHASPVYRAGIAEALAQSFERGHDPNRIRLALRLDPIKPMPAILKPDTWRKDAPGLLDLLGILEETRARVPIEKLRELAPQLPNGNDERAWWTYAAFLECYGLVAPAEAEPLVRKALKEQPFREPNNRVDGYFARALCTARGLVDPYDVVLARYQKFGLTKLSKVERLYMALMFFYLAGETSGFTTFFESYSNEMWSDLRAGLVQLKEDNYIKLLDAWTKVFVGKKPGEDGFRFETAETEYEKKTGRELTTEIDRISKARDFEADLERSIHFWAAEHAEEFKAAWKTAE